MIPDDDFDPVPLPLAIIVCCGIGLLVTGFLGWAMR